MAQGIRHRSLTAEARICASVSPCRICSGPTGTGKGLLTVPPSSLSYSTMVLHTHISWEMKSKPVSGCSSET
jgi:hypothetical protein